MFVSRLGLVGYEFSCLCVFDAILFLVLYLVCEPAHVAEWSAHSAAMWSRA